jgi:hypothetical protein
MRKPLFAGLFPPPPLGIRLWLTVLGLAVGGLNLAYLTEIWLHTPAAKTTLLAFEWLLLLAVLPQGLWWAWRWLRAYTGPGWLQVLATAMFLSGACVALALWLAVLVGGIGTLLFRLAS